MRSGLYGRRLLKSGGILPLMKKPYKKMVVRPLKNCHNYMKGLIRGHYLPAPFSDPMPHINKSFRAYTRKPDDSYPVQILNPDLRTTHRRP